MRAAKKAETWYTADEAVAAGLADSVAASADSTPANSVTAQPQAAASPPFVQIAANANRRRR